MAVLGQNGVVEYRLKHDIVVAVVVVAAAVVVVVVVIAVAE